MAFYYHWKNREANFGPPIEEQVPGGMHLTFEIILKKDGRYIALRRPYGIPEHELPPTAGEHPNGLLYFCHNLIRCGESMEDCVARIVRDQASVGVVSSRVVYIDSSAQVKDGSWAVVPHVLAEVDAIPKTNELVTEVIAFDTNSIPNDFAWWDAHDLKEFLEEYDK